MLSEQINQLEVSGVITRNDQMIAGVSHSLYSFSDYGRTLIPALDALGNWGLGHAERTAAVE